MLDEWSRGGGLRAAPVVRADQAVVGQVGASRQGGGTQVSDAVVDCGTATILSHGSLDLVVNEAVAVAWNGPVVRRDVLGAKSQHAHHVVRVPAASEEELELAILQLGSFHDADIHHVDLFGEGLVDGDRLVLRVLHDLVPLVCRVLWGCVVALDGANGHDGYYGDRAHGNDQLVYWSGQSNAPPFECILIICTRKVKPKGGAYNAPPNKTSSPLLL